jgi:nucleoside phosphorylase
MTSGVGDKRPASALDTTARPPSLADDATAAAADAARHRSQHLARHRLVLAELGLAIDRRAQLEDKGIRPRVEVKALTATRREDFMAAVGISAGDAPAAKHLHHIEKFRFKPAVADAAATLPAALQSSRPLDTLGLELPARNEPHTIDIERYLSNRLSTVALQKVKQLGAEFFFGGAAELKAWSTAQGWTVQGSIGAPNSNDFVYLQRGSEEKVMITGVLSQARLKHTVLQLHYAGIDTARLSLRGDLESLQAATLGRLAERLATLPDVPEKLCFFGARRQVSQALQRLMAEGGLPGATLSAPTSVVVDSFAFDHMTLQLPGRELLVIGMRMPNGDLADGSVGALLDSGVGTLVMCGAGGALQPDLQVGDYLEIDAAVRDGDQPAADAPVPASTSTLTPSPTPTPARLPAPEGAKRGGTNITVDSPLEETEAWLADAATRADCVDVESVHVFRALARHQAAHPEAGVQVVAGLFISDVVGEQPLAEKISSGDAYAGLGAFIGGVLDSVLAQPRA